jgi:tRNA nucleotidyltransferase (CCA-adding enzyme)
LKQGFKQVGASFPVFIHPQTGEEHALARTERKQGHGYHGFTVDFHPGVTLEEDLARRDLTINAMARGEDGRLIDPFGGKDDLDARILRHVSEAFSEDPLRVLRVARFAARFAQLGFTVHESTMELMRGITNSGELSHLVAERTWGEIRSALETSMPSVFIRILRDCGALAELLPEVDCLFGVPQPEQYHPEIDTGIHVLMTMDFAAARGWGAEIVFALLVHDLGKELCSRLRVPGAYRDLALKVCALHLRSHRVGEINPGRMLALLEDADLLRRPEQLDSFLRACEADYRGRKGLEERPYPQARLLRTALDTALAVRVDDIRVEGLSGPEIGEKLRLARIEAIGEKTVD